jgi:hypothetical protein
MFRFFVLVVLFSVLVSNIPGMAQHFTDVVSYMEYMNNEQELIAKDLWNYTKTAAHSKNVKRIENKRKELLITISESRRKIGRLPDFEEDGSLRDSLVSYLNLSYLILKEDYAKIVDMEEIAEQSYDLMEAYILAQEMANEKLEFAGQMISDEQKAFADKHNITLIENQTKLSQKLATANKVIKYYDEIYLIFFKSYKQEAYMNEAIEKADVNAIEQNRNALVSCSTEGLLKVDHIKSYQGDRSLKTECYNLLMFYKEEASNKIPIFTDFYLTKENFDKIQANIESKRKSELTQSEVDQYNNAISEFNSAVNKFNQTGEELSKTRNKLLDSWNKTTHQFLDKHVP